MTKHNSDNLHALAFMNAYSEGKSGGDVAFIEIFKRLRFGGLTVVTSYLGKALCESCGLKASYMLTSSEERFGNMYFTYFKRIVRSLLSLFGKEKFDLIYSSSDAIPDIFPAFLLKLKNNNIKWVVKRYHNIPQGRFLSFLFQKLSLFFIKRSDLIIQDGKFGFDADFIDKVAASKQKYDVIFVSRIHASKGVFDLIHVLKNVVDSREKVNLAVVGFGNEKVNLDLKKKIEEAHLQKNIDVLGFLSEKKKISLMKSSKLFLFPSHEEAFGLIVGEAMLCKIPVVAYSLPALKWCERFIFRVPCFEKDYYAKLVVGLLKDEKKRTKHVEEAYLLAKDYTWEKAAEQEKEMIANL